jgi:glutamate-1-semialdehyde aminotransferase
MSTLLPAGAQTYSRHPKNYGYGDGVKSSKSHGPYTYPSTGEKLVDLTSGLGSVILGHADINVNAAVRGAIELGVAHPLPSYREEVVAQSIIEYTGWGESVRFAKNGADVTGAAVKLARHLTNKTPIAYLDYHGHHPWSTIEPPMNGGVDEPNSFRLRRDPEYIIREIASRKYAAIVLEPWPSNLPGFEYPHGWWERLRAACDKAGTMIILDEMVSGFRCGMGGGREALDITPDLVCYGKALGNGFAVSALVGLWDDMASFENSVFFSTTHGGEMTGLAAADATIRELWITDAHDTIRNLGIEIIAHCLRLGINVKYSYPQRLVFPEFGDTEKDIMRANGVLCAGYANLTLAHGSVSDVIMNALEAVAKEI